jgi:hypothetical protein
MSAAVDEARNAFAALQGVRCRVAEMRLEADALQRRAEALEAEQRNADTADIEAAALRMVDGEDFI